MILVFGGTTEGKKVATLLQEKLMPFVYSTKTSISFKETQIASYRYGALTEKDLENYLIENNISIIINASHPFAEILHKTIAKVAENLQIPVIRFGRELLSKTINSSVFYVNNYTDALNLLSSEKTVLALTGVQSIKILKPWWLKNTTYFRILNRPESLAIATENNFPENQLILEFPSSDLDKEISIIKEKNIDIILTKETGSSGFLNTKIETALKTNTQIIIIKQPEIPKYFKVVFNETELISELSTLKNSKT
ncbi:precorrin-6A/cobalt-precorrin-6A reductase [Tenacibaculum finnmarkense]|uniref:precorrin-6A/cobalt-precorrin-6A reductase n=1 Tax=Tenacibaculum finnmarkense TaxID=2781243 RepID=UPI001EFBB13D|nr:precorrin-6A/cobalt-precorrin-6A reductase [Tenacibaculum finnmarkense]MCG8754062.1 precorrin-6A/cobalt-precorrin-6A reductase [Tenacibaculum finnmarkense]MCG8782751.1 precorrin-6A/cobalt-precorrin-6A reductase [Tenacibaculum finnmarkense]